MSDVYKKFTAQDYAVIPFNAHKQYNLNTSSYSDNRIEYFNASWTSESISLYTSASAVYGGDTKNVLKYNQLDHLFYKSFKTNNANRFGNFNYLQQRRELNEKVNILSIPTGLYGHEIKPGSLYISSSDAIMIDDKKGNLIVSGTNTDFYPTDIRSNIFRIGPSKGFKNLDLDVWKGYAVELKEPHVLHGELTKRFWRRGHNNPNAPTTYTTVSGSDLDDSYFFNSLKYYNIDFSKSSSLLGRYGNNYSFLNFNSLVGSYIVSPHNEKFNFNLEDDFSITFHVRMPDYQVSATTFEGPFDRQYIIGKSTTKTTVGPPQETRAGGVINLSQTGSASEITASAAPQFPFEIFVEGIPGGMVLPLGASGDGTIPNPTYKFVFAMSDGVNTVTASCTPLGNGAGEWQHITAVYEGVHSGSEGRLSITTTGIQGISENHKDFPGLLVTSSFTNSHPDNNRNLPILKNPLQNNANIYIGCKGEKAFENKNNESGSFFEGVLYGINIWDYALHPSESKALAHMFTYDATKYVGNIFYNQGIAVITNPVFLKEGTASFDNGGKACPSFAQTGSATSSVVFQGTHVIYENEYQCTVQENEMNFSTNITTRKIQSEDGQEIADFTTSSLFQPYVTTIGLYNEENELLVVGKLGQPVRTSQETDTTFILRWDT